MLCDMSNRNRGMATRALIRGCCVLAAVTQGTGVQPSEHRDRGLGARSLGQADTNVLLAQCLPNGEALVLSRLGGCPCAHCSRSVCAGALCLLESCQQRSGLDKECSLLRKTELLFSRCRAYAAPPQDSGWCSMQSPRSTRLDFFFPHSQIMHLGHARSHIGAPHPGF